MSTTQILNKNQIIKKLLLAATNKISPKNSALQQFKQEIQDVKHPYTSHKSKTLLYRIVFFCFGLSFTILTTILAYKTNNWQFTIVFGETNLLKNIFCIVCSFITLLSFGMAAFLSTEKEAMHFYVSHAKKRLKHLYLQKKPKMENRYKEYIDLINHNREETRFLHKRIAKSLSLTKEKKEHLYNVTISELIHRLDLLVQDF